MPHSSTSLSPSFLLYGYHPITASTLLQSSEDSIHRPYPSDNNSALNSKDKLVSPQVSESFKADIFLDEFKTFRDQSKQALQFSQAMQQKIYNQGRLSYEFNQGDLVLIDPHSLELLETKKGRGKKLLMKYDGPFEVQQKITPMTYWLWMLASYGLHPIFNIAC